MWSMDERVNRWKANKVSESGECWLWTGAKTRNGYGQVVFGGKHWMAHRAFYTHMVGEIPAGLDLDHLCRNRACVNPKHLEPVTRSENLKRGTCGMHKRPDHCVHGHPYDEANTYWNRGRRVCRTCARIRAQRDRDRKAGIGAYSEPETRILA